MLRVGSSRGQGGLVGCVFWRDSPSWFIEGGRRPLADPYHPRALPFAGGRAVGERRVAEVALRRPAAWIPSAAATSGDVSTIWSGEVWCVVTEEG